MKKIEERCNEGVDEGSWSKRGKQARKPRSQSPLPCAYRRSACFKRYIADDSVSPCKALASTTTMVLLSILPLAALASAKCFEPSVAHPPPAYDPHDPLLQQAFTSIDTALTIAVAAPEFASTSFSVEITSSKESLWSLHHTARARNTSRPDIPHVNSDALYRIASITKAFTVLGILYQHEAGNLSLDETVNKYIKELGDKSDGGIPWKDITLRSLASQLSGIPRECIRVFSKCNTAQGMKANSLYQLLRATSSTRISGS